MLNVAVVMGGPSSEYDVSLMSGQNIIRHLKTSKYRIFPIIITKDEKWICGQVVDKEKICQWDSKKFLNTLKVKNNNNLPLESISALNYLKSKSVDLFFLAMHGRYGEDGRLQSFLDIAGINYTGSRPLSSALTIHKACAKRLCENDSLLMAQDYRIFPGKFYADPDKIIKAVTKLGEKIVLKLMDSGSSLDMVILEDPSEGTLYQHIKLLVKDGEVLAEEFIKGRELTCGVLERMENSESTTKIFSEPLAVTEICLKNDKFFSYNAKYSKGAAEEITPAKLPDLVTKKIQNLALKCHLMLQCSGYSRTDFILSENEKGKDDFKIYYLETNTLPGMTENSLLPQGALAMGISMSELLDRIINLAMVKSNKKNKNDH